MSKFIAIKLIFICLALMCFGCHRDTDASRAMDNAETIIMSFPDSAISILENIGNDNLKSDFDQYRYKLLITIASDKCDLPLTDSLELVQVADFFSINGNSHYQMLSQLYLGRYYYCHCDYASAIVPLIKAATMAEEQSDFFHVGLSHQFLQEIYREIYDGPNELIHAQKSVDAYSKCDAPLHLKYSQLSLIEAYFNCRKCDDCISHGKSLIKQWQNNVPDSFLIAKCYSIIARANFKIGKYLEVINNIDSIKRYGVKPDSIDMDLYWLSSLENKSPNINLFNEYNYEDNPTTKWISGVIANNSGDKIKAYDILKSYYDKQQEIIRNLMTQSVSATLNEYNTSELKLHKLQIEHNKSIRIFSLSVIVLVFIIILLSIWLYVRQNKIREYQLYKTIDCLKNDLDIKNIEIAESNRISKAKQHEIKSYYFDEIINALNLLGKTIKHNNKKNKTISFNSITKEINDIVNDLQNNGEIFCRIESLVDVHYNGLMTDFKKDVSTTYSKVFLYHILKLSNEIIAILLNTDKKSVYNQNARLRTAIKNSESERKEEYLQHLKYLS